MHRGTDVVDEPRQGQLRRTGPAPNGFLRLKHDHREAGRGELDRRHEAVGTGPNHDRIVAQGCCLGARNGLATRRKGAPVM
jgi:hypothetical protein